MRLVVKRGGDPSLPSATPSANAIALDELNPAQAEAAQTLEGPVLVIAGAGTGKTKTLVHRLVALVRGGAPPDSILLLTFTRRAAQEMVTRASGLLNDDAQRIAGGTFHWLANRMLRRFGTMNGLGRDFSVIDQGDCFEIISGIRSDLKLSGRDRGFPQRGTIAAIISKSVNKQTPIAEILQDEYPQFEAEAKELQRIAKLYADYKRKRRLIDFDDLLVQLIALLEGNAEAHARITDQYRYLMVDEYQDTNILQARITTLLAGEAKNVMVVGDDAQSVYAFRGACHRNLFEFRDAFTNAKLVQIEQNYRSTQPILDVANAVMGQMSTAFRKRLFTEKTEGDRPLLVIAKDEDEQARFVTKQVQRLVKQGVRRSEIGVLFRASSQAFSLELHLQSQKVPYVKYGGFRFMEAAHIKDVLSHLRVLANPVDDLSLTRALTLCEGIGRASARKIQEQIGEQTLAEALRSRPGRGKAQQSLGQLAALMTDLARDSKPVERLARVLEYYTPILKARYDDWPKRERDLKQLVALCERYRSLEVMLTELALDPPSNATADELVATPEQSEQLVLSTMHSAKGLEWRVVFVIQAVEGAIPMVYRSDGMDEDDDKIDEELRLFYVAVTRAKEQLYLVCPQNTARSYYGWAEPSRFIEPMPAKLLDRQRASVLMRDAQTSKRKQPKKKKSAKKAPAKRKPR